MIISFTNIVAIALGILLTSTVLAVAAFFTAVSARKRSRDTHVAAGIATLRVAELENTVTRYAEQMEALLAERERERSTPTRPSLREAVALSRHGASTDELVSTCSIGQSEARLIQMLYGAQKRSLDDATACEVH